MPPLAQPSAPQQTKRPATQHIAVTFLIQPSQGR